MNQLLHYYITLDITWQLDHPPRTANTTKPFYLSPNPAVDWFVVVVVVVFFLAFSWLECSFSCAMIMIYGVQNKDITIKDERRRCVSDRINNKRKINYNMNHYTLLFYSSYTSSGYQFTIIYILQICPSIHSILIHLKTGNIYVQNEEFAYR